MFLFVLLTLINSHLIDTTAKNDSFKSLHYGNLHGLALSFSFCLGMRAARISGGWQINIFQMKASNIYLTIFPWARAVLFYAD